MHLQPTRKKSNSTPERCDQERQTASNDNYDMQQHLANLLPGQSALDHPHLCNRVFKVKLKET